MVGFRGDLRLVGLKHEETKRRRTAEGQIYAENPLRIFVASCFKLSVFEELIHTNWLIDFLTQIQKRQQRQPRQPAQRGNQEEHRPPRMSGDKARRGRCRYTPQRHNA